MTGEPDDALLARYLVGTCSDEEKARVEEHMFARDDVFERLQQIEEDLIDRRVRGEVAGAEREDFDRAYAAPVRRQRVLFSATLRRLLAGSDRAAPARTARDSGLAAAGWWSWLGWSPGFRVAFAAAAVVAAAGIGIMAWQASELRDALTSARAENEALRQQRAADRQRLDDLERRTASLGDDLSRERAARAAAGTAPPAPRLMATFVLAPGLLRSARGPARLLVRPAVEDVRLQLDLEPGIDATRFRLELRDNDGRVLWNQDGVRVTGTDGASSVAATVPAAVLTAGEYEVVLLGAPDRGPLEELGRYYFDVVRE